MPDETPKPEPIHPGDIVQITDPAHAWYPGLLVVDQTFAWGAWATMMVIGPNGTNLEQTRIKRAAFEVVGAAALLTKEVADAREQSLASVEVPATSDDAALAYLKLSPDAKSGAWWDLYPEYTHAHAVEAFNAGREFGRKEAGK